MSTKQDSLGGLAKGILWDVGQDLMNLPIDIVRQLFGMPLASRKSAEAVKTADSIQAETVAVDDAGLQMDEASIPVIEEIETEDMMEVREFQEEVSGAGAVSTISWRESLVGSQGISEIGGREDVFMYDMGVPVMQQDMQHETETVVSVEVVGKNDVLAELRSALRKSLDTAE